MKVLLDMTLWNMLDSYNRSAHKCMCVELWWSAFLYSRATNRDCTVVDPGPT